MSRGKGPPPPKVNKYDLPSKLCATCGKPFTWRKKWEKVWDEIRYCSRRCREGKERTRPGQSAAPDD